MPTLPKDAIVAYIDGGSRGNPGPAGYGVHVETADGQPLEELHEAVGVATNNVAEYRGLLAALGWAAEHGHRRLHVRSDSLLLVQQMRGAYRVKNPGLQPLYQRAKALVERFEKVTFEHVAREFNRDADRLANLAMDEAADGPAPRPASSKSAGGEGRTPGPAPRTPGSGPDPARPGRLPFDD